MKQSYTESELKKIQENIQPRTGWDFSRMNTVSSPPWDYITTVKRHIKTSDKVLDIGTGGGERFLQLASSFYAGVGIDLDPEMVRVAMSNGESVDNVSFLTKDDGLAGLDEDFNVILNRHAPFNLKAVKAHLVEGGLFITQQVGNLNMLNIKQVLGTPIPRAPIDSDMLSSSGLKTIKLEEYNITYIVKDIESLVYWLGALDMLHSDIAGANALKSVNILNNILAGNVTNEGFITNEQRCLVIAQKQ